MRDNTVTGIEDIPVDAVSGNQATGNEIYDLQGRRVRDTNTHGVFICNGVKVVK